MKYTLLVVALLLAASTAAAQATRGDTLRVYWAGTAEWEGRMSPVFDPRAGEYAEISESGWVVGNHFEDIKNEVAALADRLGARQVAADKADLPDCRHGTLQCIGIATQRIRVMGWDFHMAGDIVLPADSEFRRYTWTPPVTGEPAVGYVVQVEFAVSDTTMSFWLQSGAEGVKMRAAGVDEQGRQGEWSDWSE